MNYKISLFIFSLFVFSFLNNVFAEEAQLIKQKELNIYSARKEEFLEDLIKRFSEQYNIKVNVKSDPDVYKLIESIRSNKSSGVNDPRLSPDLLITADVSSIDYAKKENLLEKSNCKMYEKINSFFLDGECYWSALSFRARVLAYSKERIKGDLLSRLVTYKSLIEKDNDGNFLFGKKLVLTPISSPYNQFFIAYLIKLYGEDFANIWIKNLIDNLSIKRPSGNDTGKLEEIENGSGDLTIVNSYYFFRKLLSGNSMGKDDNGKINSEFASKVGIIFPNQDEKGTSINFSAIGLVSDATHKEEAEEFIQFILSEEAQNMILKNNHEYSVTLSEENEKLNHNVTDKKIIFDMDTNPVDISQNIKKALEIAANNNWN